MTDGDGKAETSIDTLLAGAKVTFANAEQLYLEAKVLAEVGATARALCLHQISLEECAKVENLGAWAVSFVLGHDVDEKKVLTAHAHHAAKNKQNAYMLEPSQDEKDARERGDIKAALDFQKTQVRFHAKSNGAKNASLYVRRAKVAMMHGLRLPAPRRSPLVS